MQERGRWSFIRWLRRWWPRKKEAEKRERCRRRFWFWLGTSRTVYVPSSLIVLVFFTLCWCGAAASVVSPGAPVCNSVVGSSSPMGHRQSTSDGPGSLSFETRCYNSLSHDGCPAPAAAREALLDEAAFCADALCHIGTRRSKDKKNLVGQKM